jgi:Acetyltransferase (GNAT) family
MEFTNYSRGRRLAPQASGGAAAHLLHHLLDEAKSRADATMMLEEIEQNPRAVALYSRHGFCEISRLRRWARGIRRRRLLAIEFSPRTVTPIPDAAGPSTR